jgi:hypothetical protein
MRHKSKLTLMLLTIIIFSFPSVCFSESRTVESEYCDVYLGDMKNKKELEKFRKSVRKESIENGVILFLNRVDFTRECFNDVISRYLEKVVVVSHTKTGRNICDKVKITFDPEVINKYLYQESCLVPSSWEWDICGVLTKRTGVLMNKSDKINIGIIIETRIPNLEVHKRELLENEEEKQFFYMMRWGTSHDKYKVVDRRHLTKILEEQKLSSSGITDSETVKLGKILNLDIIVLRILYENSQATKVLKVDTGEILLFKTYETKTEEGWIYFGESQDNYEYYYDKTSMITVSQNVFNVWMKRQPTKDKKDKVIQGMKEHKAKEYKKLLDDGWDKLDYNITLQEVDCRNNTIKTIKVVIYNDEGKILRVIDIPNPGIQQVLPETMDDLLIRKICLK